LNEKKTFSHHEIQNNFFYIKKKNPKTLFKHLLDKTKVNISKDIGQKSVYMKQKFRKAGM